MDINKAKHHGQLFHPGCQEPNTGLGVTLDDSEESYFDLNLGLIPHSEEFEIQISLSSISTPELCSQISAFELNNGNILPLQDKESSSPSAPNDKTQVTPSDDSVLLKSLSKILGVGPLSFRKFRAWNNPGPSLNTDVAQGYRLDGDHRRELTGTRKSSKIVAIFNNNAIKFLVKFPSEIFRSAFISPTQSQRSFYHPSEARYTDRILETSPRHQKLIRPIHKWLPQRNSKRSNGSNRKTNTIDNQPLGGLTEKPRISYINGGEIIGTLNALSLSFGNKNMDFGRHPASIMLSPCPSEFYQQKVVFERDGSISAAVAHCRLSFDSGNKL